MGENPLQYSCLENSRDRGAWWAAVYGAAQSRTWPKQLNSGSSMDEKALPFLESKAPSLYVAVSSGYSTLELGVSSVTMV